ncbi:hypothetical protein GGF31_002767 [Allomyces arbusculus]|nr:hypothetical protein GGF31_002767 [Allomyces arbusculus]
MSLFPADRQRRADTPSPEPIATKRAGEPLLQHSKRRALDRESLAVLIEPLKTAMEGALDAVQAKISECFETAIQNALVDDADSCIAEVDEDDLDDADSDEDPCADDAQQHAQDARGEYHESVQDAHGEYHEDAQDVHGEYHEDVQIVNGEYHVDVQIVNGEQVHAPVEHHQDAHGEQVHEVHYHACNPLESLRAVVPAAVPDNKHAAGAKLESDRKGSEVFDRTYTNTPLEHHIVVEDMFEIVQRKPIEVSICADRVVRVTVDGKDGPYVRVYTPLTRKRGMFLLKDACPTHLVSGHSDDGLVAPSPAQLTLFLKQLWE